MGHSTAEMNVDEIKDFTLETCRTPMQMDLHQMSKGLEKWGFKIEDWDNLSPELPGAMPIYLVWLDCSYGLDLCKTNLNNWVDECQFPWLGSWTFVVRFCVTPDKPKMEFQFTCERYLNGVWVVKNLKGSSPRLPQRRADTMPQRTKAEEAMALRLPPIKLEIDDL